MASVPRESRGMPDGVGHGRSPPVSKTAVSMDLSSDVLDTKHFRSESRLQADSPSHTI